MGSVWQVQIPGLGRESGQRMVMVASSLGSLFKMEMDSLDSLQTTKSAFLQGQDWKELPIYLHFK